MQHSAQRADDNQVLRKSVITVLLFTALGVGLAVASVPHMKPDKPGILAVLCLMLAAILGGKLLWRRSGWGILWLCATAAFMLPFIVIARAFGSVDMMALAFHTKFGIKGGGIGGLENEIIAAGLSMFVVILAAAFLASLWPIKRLVLGGVGFILLLANPVIQFAAKGFFFPPPPSDLAQHYVANIVLTPTLPLPDLLVIYLEGSDRQYEDTAVFGDAFAPIKGLLPEALAFTRVAQISGTGWSMAGIIASQCGVPALPKGMLDSRKKMDDVADFMPSVTCLGDLLSPYEYQTEFLVGVEAEFAGIDKFFRDHGIKTLIGTEQIRTLVSQAEFESAHFDWLLDDQILFDVARLRHNDLSADPRPYAMIIQTSGPHGKAGVLSRSCGSDRRALLSKDLALLANCTAGLSVDFVNELREKQKARGRPLRILMVSDHLNHAGIAPGVGAEFAGYNTVLMVGGPDLGPQAGTVNAAPGAMVDVFPTFLEWAGLSQPPVAAGIGRSLISGPPSLLAERGLEVMDAMLRHDSALADKIWE